MPRVSLWEFTCHAPEELFQEWEDVPDDIKAEIDENGPLPCSGDGGVGPWCADCRFGEEECIE
jgi:hypothetical protein